VAQTTGRIDGRASGPQNTPLAGVRVTASSPSLPGTVRAVTDARGDFRLLALPPGEYRVLAEVDGFHPVERREVRVPLDGSIVLDIALTPAFEERVTVQGSAPVIDATSVSRGVVLPSEVFEALPIARSSGVLVSPNAEGANALAVLAPGVVPTGTGVPRSAGSGLSENRTLVDGLETTHILFGGAGVGFPFEFIEEVEVKTGGYGPEYSGALGAVINVLTRSGGNRHRGEVFGFYRDQTGQRGEFGRAPGFSEYEYGLDAGGRLVRDRLWYFLALDPHSVETKSVSLDGRTLTPGWEAIRFSGKITGQVATGHRLNVSAFGRGLDEDVRVARAIGLHGSDHERDARAFSVTWDGSFGSSLLVEAVAGRFEFDAVTHALDDSAATYLDLTPGHWAAQQDCGGSVSRPVGEVWFHPGCLGGDTIVDPAASSRDQLRAAATWLGGRHELKAGGSVFEQRLVRGERLPGPFVGPLIDADGVVVDDDGVSGSIFRLDLESYSVQEFQAEGHPWADEYAVFVRDRFEPSPYLTLDLGIRADSYRNGVRETPRREHRLVFGLDDMLAPRLGVVWAFTRDGRSRWFAHLGRYYESMPLFASLLSFGPGIEVFHTFEYPADGSLPTFTNLGVFASSEDFGSDPLPVVPGLQPTHTDEASVGVEYELGRGLALGLNLVYSELGDVIETESFDDVFVLGNPGGSHTVNPATGEPLEEPADYDEPVHRYRALELTLHRPLRNGWQLYASYVYAESEGNYTGLDPDAHVTAQFDFARLSEGAFGRLPGDQPHQLKVWGSYTSPIGLTVGFVGHQYSGTPISKLGFWPSFYERFVEPRGTAGRTPDVSTLDLHLGYSVPFDTGAVRLDLVVDALNVTNEQTVVAVDEMWTFAEGDGVNPGECGGADPACVNEDGDPVGNPSWGEPVAFQEGRNVRFGVKLRW
jgi:outer membrane receptor protein involved in Fe transport